ncbi:MAG: hypothetical protein WCV69_01750 [Patescibacteria group bacterium]|jgi:hypothetical protein
MFIDDLKNLPDEIREYISSDELINKNIQIFGRYPLNNTQTFFIMDLVNLVFLKKISVLDFPVRLEEMERASYYDLRAISLDIALNIFWPIQDYLGNVDRLILRLGGKVPKAIHLKSVTLQKKLFPEHAHGTVKQFMSDYDDFVELRISAKKIAGTDFRRLMPTLDNWIKDYVHYLGAGYHNSLQRAQYLAKSPNALELDPKERESLRCFLLSYDENMPIDIENQEGVLWAELKQEKDEQAPEVINIETAIANLNNNVNKLDQLLLPESFVLSEAGNDIYKVRDILWNAVAMNDKEKVLSCLKVLVSHKALDSLISEDSRFISILKRFIGVRYGNDIGLWFGSNQDKLLGRRLFLELILAEKLRLSELESAVAAFYLTSQWAQSGQVTYLDQKDGQLKWRNLQVTKNQLSWQDN